MAYKIEFTASAKKQFDKLTQATRKRIGEALDKIASDPRHPGVVKLSGEEGLYRVRSGDYRVVYRIEDARLLVLVLKIGHRSDVYR